MQHRLAQKNVIAVHMSDGSCREMSGSILSIGSLSSNDVVIVHSSVSRRHAVVINFPKEVGFTILEAPAGLR